MTQTVKEAYEAVIANREAVEKYLQSISLQELNKLMALHDVKLGKSISRYEKARRFAGILIYTHGLAFLVSGLEDTPRESFPWPKRLEIDITPATLEKELNEAANRE